MKQLIILFLILTLNSAFGQSELLTVLDDGVHYTTEASTLFARMDTQPDATRKALIDNTISRLKNNSLFTGFDALWVTAAHDSQSALLNWIENDHNLIAYKSIEFVTDSGFYGNSADSSYLNTDFNSFTDGINFTKLDASIGTYVPTNIAEDHTFQLGSSNGGDADNLATGTIWRTDQLQAKLNEGSSAYVDVYTGGRKKGLFAISRTDSLTTLSYFNGYLQVTDASQPTGNALLNGSFHILNNGTNNANNSNNMVSLAWVGRSFNATEMDSLYTIFYDYLSAVGCADTWSNDTLAYNIFEGTGYDNYSIWTESGTVNEDFTSTVLEGSQSLSVASGGNTYRNIPIYGDTTNVFFMFQVADATPASTANIFYSYNSAGTALFPIRNNTNGTLLVYSGGTSSSGTTVLQDNTTYYCWIQYIKGTGSNSITRVWLSTNGTKPASPEKEITNGNATTQCSRVRFYANASNSIFDKLIVTRATIGNQ